MPWIRIDEHYDEHLKFAKAGPLGVTLWLAGLAYCNRNLTDGFIPWVQVDRLVNWKFIDEPDESGRSRVFQVGISCGHVGEDVTCRYVAERLATAGLWEEVEGGYQVHDYADYQPLKELIEAERAGAKERMQRVRTARRSRLNGSDDVLPKFG